MSLQEVHTVCGLEALVPVMMRRQERKDVTYEAKPCKLHRSPFLSERVLLEPNRQASQMLWPQGDLCREASRPPALSPG